MTAQQLLDVFTDLKGYGLELDRVKVTFSPDANTAPKTISGFEISQDLPAPDAITTTTLVFYHHVNDYMPARELE